MKGLKETCESDCHREIPGAVSEVLKCEFTLVINSGHSRMEWEHKINIYCVPTKCQALVRYFHVVSLSHHSNTSKK